MPKLNPHDLLWCIKRLPSQVVTIMKSRPNTLFVAGGFVRACVANEKISDIDLFAPNRDISAACSLELSKSCGDARIWKTENSFTVKIRPIPAQFIHRWTFQAPADAIDSFDFTIARAAFWWDGKTWDSVIDPDFYADLAAHRLVYRSPVRIEEAGGSLLRVLKFYQRGYRIPLDSLGAVIARLESAIRDEELPIRGGSVDREAAVARIFTGLLREVDPLLDPDHVSHLPAITGTDEPDADPVN